MPMLSLPVWRKCWKKQYCSGFCCVCLQSVGGCLDLLENNLRFHTMMPFCTFLLTYWACHYWALRYFEEGIKTPLEWETVIWL